MRVHTLVGEHLQRFQSPRSYRAHALSSVAKSSLSQLDMAELEDASGADIDEGETVCDFEVPGSGRELAGALPPLSTLAMLLFSSSVARQ